MKTRISPVLIIFSLVCFVLLPNAHAVVPAPDGGYPNFTTAEGTNALFSLTTGAANTAVGWFSLKTVTTGSFNTGVGGGTLVLNTGDENTAIGTAALLLNTASGNTAVGSRSLLNNTAGGTLGNIQGIDVGPNVAVGQQALDSNTVASANTAVGYQALHSFTTGPMGFEQLGLCTAVGFQALANATDGFDNNAFGYQALLNNTDGVGNTAVGSQALFNNDIGRDNVAIGSNAGHDITGDGNVCIGSNVPGFAGEDNTTRIRNIGSTPQGGGLTVSVESVGGTKLGYVPSSRRYKDDIKSMDKASEGLFALKPVTFRYKKNIDPAQMRAFGLIAEEVEKVSPDLVAHNPDGQAESVRYEYINAMLLNEFLKEHRRNDEQQATIARLTTRIDEQAAQIQKVSAQLAAASPSGGGLEASKFATRRIRRGGPAPQVVNNP
jgi:Chaperone of endosialidase